MAKQTKEEFLKNVREHANSQILWGVFDWIEDDGYIGSSADIADDIFARETAQTRLCLDLRLADLYEKCVAKEKELIAAVRKLNAECRARLEEK